MPLWTFKCDCGHIEDDVHGHRCDPDLVAPIHCGKKMDVLLTTCRPGVEVFESYETSHMHPEGKTLKVRNSGDLKQFQREFGVRRVDSDMVSQGGRFTRRKDAPVRTYIH